MLPINDAELQRKALLAQMGTPTGGGVPDGFDVWKQHVPSGGITGMYRDEGGQVRSGYGLSNSQTTNYVPPTGGVMGYGDQGPAPVPASPSSAPVPINAPMRGFDTEKLADPGHTSEKYQIGRVMQQFDPKLGVTPDMLAALNALGIAEFSGSGDKLTVNNTKNDPRFGKGGTADVVYGLKGQNADTAWQPWFVDDGGGQAGPAQAQGGPAMGGGGIPLNPLVAGDPLAQIKAAIAQYGGESTNLQALLKQLGV